MLTEADDYSWVPLGDVLVALMDIDGAERAWPEGQPVLTFDTLIRAEALRLFLHEVSGDLHARADLGDDIARDLGDRLRAHLSGGER